MLGVREAGLEWRAWHGIARLAAHVAHGPVAHELFPETSDALIPLSVTVADDDDFGAFGEIGSDSLREPQWSRRVVSAGNE